MIKIVDNLFSGDCGLWYDVTYIFRGRIGHCVCPYDICKSFQDAIDFYYKVYHKDGNEPFEVKHHKFSREDMEILSLAC